jgi:transcription initiation factor TFIIB
MNGTSKLKRTHNHTKTHKNKRNTKKYQLWETFDKEVGNKPDLECLYSKQQINIRDICDKCGSNVSYNEDRYLTCIDNKCGIIYKDHLDDSPEWRYYGADDNKSSDPTRCGMPINPLLKESSYGCKVICPMNSSYEMRKIRRYTEWQSMPYKEKSQYDEFIRIKTLSHHAGIPKIIIDEAMRYHKKLSEMRTFRGCNRDGIIAASIYIACKIHDFPRTANEIATIFKLSISAATKGCKNAVHLVNQLEKNMDNINKTRLCKTTPAAFIERYCSKLGFNQELTTVCLFVAKRIDYGCKIQENTPHSVAAGIVFFVSTICNLDITKRQVHKISEISEVTINKCYKKLYDIHETDKLLPLIILTKYK